MNKDTKVVLIIDCDITIVSVVTNVVIADVKLAVYIHTTTVPFPQCFTPSQHCLYSSAMIR